MSVRVSVSDLCNRGLLTLAPLALTGASQPPQDRAVTDFTVRLAPHADGAGQVDYVDMTLRVDANGEAPRFGLSFVVTNVVSVAGGLDHVEARDAQGPLPLSRQVDGDADTGRVQWVAGRNASGMVTVRYRVPASSVLAPRGPAPPLELRSEGGAVSGSGSTFILLPVNQRSYRLAVEWDLSALPAGSAAVSSLGEGNQRLDEPTSPSRLSRMYFMAGRIGRFPAAPSGSRFFAAWQGTPPFDATPLMERMSRMHGRFMTFFRRNDAPPYGVFLRRNPVNPGGGVGLSNSFIATFEHDTDSEDLSFTLVHEMFHTFAPSISTPAGLESSWFGEGLAVFYQRVLPLRFGETSAGAFLRDLNFHAGRYYTSRFAEAPNSEVPARFWQDTRIRTLPYDRGSLYFADLNHRIRRASGGRRSLDDLVVAMSLRERAGRRLSNADWEELVRAELGQAGVDHFRAMLAGRMPLPASEAFGPCFRQTTRPLRRYELGFTPAVLTEQPKIVRGLVPGSAAERAGLRDGDEILRPFGQDSLQGDQNRTLTIAVRRNGREMEITYLPRGETVPAYQWERVGRLPDAQCAI